MLTSVTLSPIRNTPPADSNAFLSIIWVLTPGTEGGRVPIKLTFPLTLFLTSSRSLSFLSPKTAGSIMVSPSSASLLTSAMNFLRAPGRLIIFAMFDERISLGFFLRFFMSSVEIAVILHFTPFFSNASAMNAVLKSRKPSMLTINAFSHILQSRAGKISISFTVNQVRFGRPDADIIHSFLALLPLSFMPREARYGMISLA